MVYGIEVQRSYAAILCIHDRIIILLFLQAGLGVAQQQVQRGGPFSVLERVLVGASPQVQSCTFTKSLS